MLNINHYFLPLDYTFSESFIDHPPKPLLHYKFILIIYTLFQVHLHTLYDQLQTTFDLSYQSHQDEDPLQEEHHTVHALFHGLR